MAAPNLTPTVPQTFKLGGNPSTARIRLLLRLDAYHPKTRHILPLAPLLLVPNRSVTHNISRATSLPILALALREGYAILLNMTNTLHSTVFTTTLSGLHLLPRQVMNHFVVLGSKPRSGVGKRACSRLPNNNVILTQ
jgi:hypothetical protein